MRYAAALLFALAAVAGCPQHPDQSTSSFSTQIDDYVSRPTLIVVHGPWSSGLERIPR